MTEIARSRTVAAPVAAVWNTLADFGAIDEWAPNVDHSSLLRSPDGPGAVGVDTVRRIQSGRRTLLERVVTFDEPKVLAYELDGLPPVVRSARNEWRLESQGGGATAVTLTSYLDCGPRPPQQLVARVVGRIMAKQSVSMLSGLAHRLEDPHHA